MSQTPYTITASFKARPDRWQRFKLKTAELGVSTCHVLDGLMEAWLQGQDSPGRSLHRTPTQSIPPVSVNLTMHHVVKRPRRMAGLEDLLYSAQGQRWPPNCEHADAFIKSTLEVGCLDIKDWISLEKCWRCFAARQGLI